MLSKKSVNLAKLLKELYNQDYINNLSLEIQKEYASFDVNQFCLHIFDDKWETKELKQRMRHISTSIGLFLVENYEKSINILKKVFLRIDTKFALENMIFQDFVEVYGLDKFEVSMDALESFTIGSSSEFAIRQFILKYPKETMKQMLLWTKSSNEHVRRLASEGCRSRLPWAIALDDFKYNPSQVLEILEVLKDDESPYVRKSVANSLNDISKDNPNILKSIVKEWIGKNTQRDALLKHASRTLLKSSDKDILELFGFKGSEHLHVEQFRCMSIVKLGSDLEFSFIISSDKDIGKLRLEYKLWFLRKNGTYGEKVFKISESNIKSKNKKFTKKHSFKTISTRKYYKGVQKLSIVLNGVSFQTFEFMLEI